MIPRICKSELGGIRWYIVTRYRIRGDGILVAQRKYDVSDQMEAILQANKTKGGNRLKTYKGSTAKRLAEKCPILGAEFWQPGIRIEGRVIRPFSTANGMCYEIMLDQPIEVEGQACFPKEPGKIKTNRVAVGSLKGFGMALAQAGRDPMIPGDRVKITATGTTPTENDSPMVNFEVEVTPPGH